MTTPENTTTTANHLPSLPWMPYHIIEVPCENRVGFIGRGAAMFINGQPCVVMTRGQLELENIGNYLTGDTFDKTQIYKVTLIETQGVLVQDPGTEELPINLPAAEHESPLPDTTADAEIVGDVPMYQGRPIARYITPQPEFVEDLADEKREPAKIPNDDEL